MKSTPSASSTWASAKWPMRTLAITGMVTAAMISRILLGGAIRATPPSARMSAGTRSSAITATAPASWETRACSELVTSMITPPFSISANPVFNRIKFSFIVAPGYRTYMTYIVSLNKYLAAASNHNAAAHANGIDFARCGIHVDVYVQQARPFHLIALFAHDLRRRLGFDELVAHKVKAQRSICRSSSSVFAHS